MPRKSSKSKKNLFWQITLFGFLSLFVFGLFVFIFFARDLPRPERFGELHTPRPTEIYDRTGEVLLFEIFGEEKRSIISIENLPEHVLNAIIVAEDTSFYKHIGIDPKGIVRSIVANIRTGTRGQGGSTISQQLIRSSLLTTKKTIARKIKEIILTLELERQYSKEEILEFYLNQVPLGSNVYGVGAASQLYFGKRAEELTAAEAAVLAAMIQAPTYYSPYGNQTEELNERKEWIINRMEQAGYLSKQEASAAVIEKLEFSQPLIAIKAPHFVLYVLDQLFKDYGEEFVRAEGLRIQTTLNWELQEKTEELVAQISKTNAGFAAHNTAVVAINPQNGEILAMVGSRNWFGSSFPEGCTSGVNCRFDPKVNVATTLTGRQPGSAFKPFVYATAFNNGYDGNATVIDEETNFGIWGDKEYIPQNYDGKFRGEVSLRQALAQSLNVPSIKVLLDFAGIKESIDTATKMGISTLNRPLSDYGPSLVLGGGEVRLLDLVSAYGVFAAEGRRTPPISITSVRGSDGKIIRRYEKSSIQVLSPVVAKEITSILSDNEARSAMFGSRSLLYFPEYEVAAKTGTTQEFRDAWTIGYTKDIVVGVWVGNNDNTPMAEKPGVVLAGPLWNGVMTKALELLTP